jgi:hypothetical protein
MSIPDYFPVRSRTGQDKPGNKVEKKRPPIKGAQYVVLYPFINIQAYRQHHLFIDG